MKQFSMQIYLVHPHSPSLLLIIIIIRTMWHLLLPSTTTLLSKLSKDLLWHSMSPIWLAKCVEFALSHLLWQLASHSLSFKFLLIHIKLVCRICLWCNLIVIRQPWWFRSRTSPSYSLFVLHFICLSHFDRVHLWWMEWMVRLHIERNADWPIGLLWT